MQNLNNKKQNHTSHFIHNTSQKGITLIALIITIIVMLILVGVAINVALNGGLFKKGEKASYQTQASTVKEQLEIAKAVAIANSKGKILDDYSGITVENLKGLDKKTIEEYKDKIVVAKDGDVCYNPENVIDAEERACLEEIGIREYVNMLEPETFKFTIGDIATNATFGDSWIIVPETSFWTDTVSDELKNRGVTVNSLIVYDNVECSNKQIVNQYSSIINKTPFETGFVLMNAGDEIQLAVFINGTYIDENNWSTYENLEFTITL